MSTVNYRKNGTFKLKLFSTKATFYGFSIKNIELNNSYINFPSQLLNTTCIQTVYTCIALAQCFH